MLRKSRQTEIIQSLSKILKENGDKILNGSSKLSLTTTSLAILNEGFAKICDVDHQTSFEVINSHNAPVPIYQDLEFLHDFIQKTILLKIIHGSNTLQGRIRINEFRSLKSLELKKLPVHLLEGLHKLRDRLTTLICSRCIHTLQDVLETCGGDMASPHLWSQLKTAIFSFNNIEELDDSLRLLPRVEVLDLSHNNFHETEDYLENLTELVHVNLAFNYLEMVPSFSVTCKTHLRTLILRNNNLDSLNGVEDILSLEELDVCFNCLVSHQLLVPLHLLRNLKMLLLEGNPLSYHQRHRLNTVVFISQRAVTKLLLDGKAFTDTEIAEKRKYVHLHQSQWGQSTASNPGFINVSFSESYSSYDFSESDSIAVRSSSSKRKRKKNLQRQLMENYAAYHTDSSAGPSRDNSSPNTPETNTFTTEEIESRRRQFGSDWLMTIPMDHEQENLPSTEEIQPDSQIATIEPKHVGHDIEKDSNIQTNETEDDIYLNGKCKELFTEVCGEDSTFIEADVHVDNALVTASGINQQNSDEQLVWQNESCEQTLVNESEPFIVTRANGQHLIISVSDRFLNEKDLEGSLVEQLDLKCLVSAVCVQTEVSSPTLKISFDYMRKDRRQRIYSMEDEEHTKHFMELIQPTLDTRKEAELKDLLQCMKCNVEFLASRSQWKVRHSVDPGLEHVHLKGKATEKGFYSEVPTCPSCGSEIVIEVDDDQISRSRSSQTSTPIGSVSSAMGIIPLATSSAKSTPMKNRDDNSSVSCGSTHGSFKSCTSDSQTLECMPASFLINENVSTLTTQSDSYQSALSVDFLDRSNIAPVRLQTFEDSVPQETNQQTFVRLKGTNSVEPSPCAIQRISDEVDPERNRYSSISSDTSISVIGDSSTILLPHGSSSNLNVQVHDDTDGDNAIKRVNGAIEDKLDVKIGSLTNDACRDMLSSVYENSIGQIQSKTVCDNNSTALDANCEKADQFNALIDDGAQLKEVLAGVLNGTPDDQTDSTTNTLQHNGVRSNSFFQESVLEKRVSLAVESNRIGFSYEDYSQLDHRLKLFLSMHVLKEDEDCQLLLKCSIIHHSIPREIPGLLIITDRRFYICKIMGYESPNVTEWLKVLEIQLVTDLQYVNIGLGHQKLRLDFDGKNESLILLIRDETRCKAFLGQFTMFLHKFFTDSKLQGITKNNSLVLEQIQTLLCVQSGMQEQEYSDADVFKYYLGFLKTDEENKDITIIVTDHVICICLENHTNFSGRDSFEVLDSQKIVNLSQITKFKESPNEVCIDIVDEDTNETCKLHIIMETEQTIDSLIDSIRLPWECEFEVSMDIVIS